MKSWRRWIICFAVILLVVSVCAFAESIEPMVTGYSCKGTQVGENTYTHKYGFLNLLTCTVTTEIYGTWYFDDFYFYDAGTHEHYTYHSSCGAASTQCPYRQISAVSIETE